jgi:conjugal transfer ATP-binding protein TraC
VPNIEKKKATDKPKQSKPKTSGLDSIFNKGLVSIPDLIAPAAIDTQSPKYIIVDGMYISTMLVISFPYQRPAGWLADIINHGEGVEVNLYYEPLEKGRLIKELTYMIGTTTATRSQMGDNQGDVDIIETSIGHARYMRQQMQTENEDPYYLYILVSVYGESLEKLEERLLSVESKLDGMDIISRRAEYRHEGGFRSSLPIHMLAPELKKSTARNALSSGLATTYPFVSSEFCDNDGIFMGLNEHNQSMVIVDIFNTALYKNANMTVLGTSGAGKTFLIQLIALRNRLQGTAVMMIAPLKGHEFKRAADGVGGQYIKISPASRDCINIMEIRKSSLEKDFDEDDGIGATDKEENTSFLLSKIQKLHIFFSLVFPDMTIEERQYLDDKLIEVYRLKGITFDNESLYVEETDRFSDERKFKRMPVLGDLYELLSKDHNTTRMALLLKRLVTGSLQLFNQQTNVNLNNKYTVADISELKEDILPLGMFLAIDLFWDKIKEDITQKKVIIIDELWNLIGSSGNKQTAQFILEIFKIIRGYGGSAIGATQDINDFFALEGGKYGKGIINNAKMKIVLQLEDEDAQFLRKVLKLSDEEIAKVTTFKRGHGLFYAGSNHIAVEFMASQEEKDMITTDRVELTNLRKKRKKIKDQKMVEEEAVLAELDRLNAYDEEVEEDDDI